MRSIRDILARGPKAGAGHVAAEAPVPPEQRRHLPENTHPVAHGKIDTIALIANDTMLRATLRVPLSPTWSKGDYLLELRKSYPDCHYDDPESPTAVIFSHDSAVRFRLHFEKILEARTTASERH